MILKILWYWHEKRQIDQWNWIESPGTGSYTYEHLTYNRDGIGEQWEKDSFLSNGAGIIGYPFEIWHLLLNHTKINSKWSIEHQSKTVKQTLEDNTSMTLVWGKPA